MTKILTILFVVLFIFFVTSCDEDKKVTGPDDSFIATEEWNSIADEGIGNGTWEFSMEEDSSVIVDGEWIYNFELIPPTSFEIKCPFNNGQVTISGPSISFIASGTAKFVADPKQTSPFTLNIEGTTNQGQGNGSYTISFTTEGWPPQLAGNWTASRTDGSGITE
ncbi:hypothetical protein JXB12_07480 [candidate division KSB1 bacterium]|nr:hypothetical protein [candidate division KSB1 bacterium]